LRQGVRKASKHHVWAALHQQVFEAEKVRLQHVWVELELLPRRAVLECSVIYGAKMTQPDFRRLVEVQYLGYSTVGNTRGLVVGEVEVFGQSLASDKRRRAKLQDW
jgi:hypothetical protein